ncbi:type VI secretion system baseplate subunit TssE [Pseudomonas syringae]|uniref:type VI secretion system baseplate subunit TssE n=1 Tax=Pseudomonas syringae TaxID=317 RepID=UPI001CAA0D16|nr:type VI secretion system baseplate subunit TssE [Pseudomonas syringae]
MNPKGSLFERLVAENMRQPPCPPGEERLMVSIASHVSQLLCTRAGTVKMLPDYGLPDLNDMSVSFHESVRQSREAIEKTVRLYEPRLSEVCVVPEENENCLLRRQFSINASVEVYGIKKPVRLFATLSGSGEVTVV